MRYRHLAAFIAAVLALVIPSRASADPQHKLGGIDQIRAEKNQIVVRIREGGATVETVIRQYASLYREATNGKELTYKVLHDANAGHDIPLCTSVEGMPFFSGRSESVWNDCFSRSIALIPGEEYKIPLEHHETVPEKLDRLKTQDACLKTASLDCIGKLVTASGGDPTALAPVAKAQVPPVVPNTPSKTAAATPQAQPAPTADDSRDNRHGTPFGTLLFGVVGLAVMFASGTVVGRRRANRRWNNQLQAGWIVPKIAVQEIKAELAAKSTHLNDALDQNRELVRKNMQLVTGQTVAMPQLQVAVQSGGQVVINQGHAVQHSSLDEYMTSERFLKDNHAQRLQTITSLTAAASEAKPAPKAEPTPASAPIFGVPQQEELERLRKENAELTQKLEAKSAKVESDVRSRATQPEIKVEIAPPSRKDTVKGLGQVSPIKAIADSSKIEELSRANGTLTQRVDDLEAWQAKAKLTLGWARRLHHRLLAERNGLRENAAELLEVQETLRQLDGDLARANAKVEEQEETLRQTDELRSGAERIIRAALTSTRATASMPRSSAAKVAPYMGADPARLSQGLLEAAKRVESAIVKQSRARRALRRKLTSTKRDLTVSKSVVVKTTWLKGAWQDFLFTAGSARDQFNLSIAPPEGLDDETTVDCVKSMRAEAMDNAIAARQKRDLVIVKLAEVLEADVVDLEQYLCSDLELHNEPVIPATPALEPTVTLHSEPSPRTKPGIGNSSSPPAVRSMKEFPVDGRQSDPFGNLVDSLRPVFSQTAEQMSPDSLKAPRVPAEARRPTLPSYGDDEETKLQSRPDLPDLPTKKSLWSVTPPMGNVVEPPKGSNGASNGARHAVTDEDAESALKQLSDWARKKNEPIVLTPILYALLRPVLNAETTCDRRTVGGAEGWLQEMILHPEEGRPDGEKGPWHLADLFISLEELRKTLKLTEQPPPSMNGV